MSPSICHEVMELDAMIFVSWMLNFKPFFFTLLFQFHQEDFWFFFAFCHKSGVICISEVIDISPRNLILACASSSPAFLMMYSAYKLNKLNIQPWHPPFPIWNQSVIPCPVKTVASWPAYRFLRRQVREFVIPTSLRISHCLLFVVSSFKT